MLALAVLNDHPANVPSVSLSDSELAAVVAPWAPQMNDPEIAFRSAGHTAIFGKPYDEAGPFPYGSITKSFTAVLTLRLAEKGLLHLDDPLSRFDKNLPGHERVTIAELLNHTSGLPEYFYGFDPAKHADESAIDRAISRAAANSKLVEGRFFYSNSNFYLLGEICSQAAKLPLADLYRTYICDPLHLTAKPGRRPTFDLGWYGGAGELEGSIADLPAFGSAVATRDPRLLTPASWARFDDRSVSMIEPPSPTRPQTYACGLIGANMSVYRTLSHGGTVPSNAGVDEFNSMLIVRPGSSGQSYAVFNRKGWGNPDLNATYGAFAACCATADTKGWLEAFAAGVDPGRIEVWKRDGVLAPDFAPDGNARSLGHLKSFIITGQLVRGDRIELQGTATGDEGSAEVLAVYGRGGRLESLRIR